MRTFSITTLGCKVNQYDSQQIRELLEQLGLRRAEPTEKPDMVVVNTCCVTSTASSKSRRHIRKAKKLNSHAVIVVCGCLTTIQIGELAEIAEHVHLAKNQQELALRLRRIVGGEIATSKSGQRQTCPYSIIRPDTPHQSKSKSKLSDHLSGSSVVGPSTNPSQQHFHSSSGEAPSPLPILTSFAGHTRAFLKVQDGCDGFCSYCIVPKTRPFVRSKPADVVLAEAGRLVAAGHKEIVVTGVFLGAYGQQSVRRGNWPAGENDALAELLDELARIPGLMRIRLSSLEPGDVTPRLLDTFCEHRKIMPHLHLALQSGSDAILKKMNRQYDSGQFREVVEQVKKRLNRPAITTDIIVGFPGETDADFEQTAALAKEAGFSKMHIFPFSVRRGTAAAKMGGKVGPAVIKERAQIMRDLNAELGLAFRQQFVGETVNVLVETVKKGAEKGVENAFEGGFYCDGEVDEGGVGAEMGVFAGVRGIIEVQPGGETGGQESGCGAATIAGGRCERYFMVYFESEKEIRKNELVKIRLV
ncbi:MAG: tRNA (N(6)-L-threonylcarbamoyladenosine(37)-C(2))-methylthiotransferase MtaB [Sedimentisphaerales bacterium]|nr:tRNA (N(6)-L-threonylcarbamoyladenosine(37)-C(2))-methylthiotransferase MtaB [Sedimentisphaerales bacterium]